MTYYPMTSDPADDHGVDYDALAARVQHSADALAQQDADYNAGRIVVNAAHHEARAALLADYRAKEEAEEAERMADEDERASAHLMAGYTSSTCGEY